MCLGLICPFGKYPLNGQCVQKYVGLRHSCLCVFYYIEVFLEPLKMKEFEFGEFMDYLEFVENEGLNHSLKMALAGRSGCNVTTSQVSKIRFANKFQPTYSVSFLVPMKPSCDLYNMIENALELIDENPVNRVINDSVDLRLKISLIANGSISLCGNCYHGIGFPIRIDNDISCPQIELDFLDVERFSSNEQKKERAIFLSFFDDKAAPSKTKVRVCIDYYLATMSTVNSGCSTIAASIVISFVLISFHVVIFVISVLSEKCAISLTG